MGSNLRQAGLPGTILHRADLTAADFTGADLSGADLTSVDLSAANLTGANLESANLRNASLSGANLTFANFGTDTLSGPAGLRLVTLRTAVNWDKAYYDDDLLKQLAFRQTTTRNSQRNRSEKKASGG
jgi:uncharacterized protein YjbI with pentapeptide repeats